MESVHKAFRNKKIRQNLHTLSYKWGNQIIQREMRKLGKI